MPRLLDAMIAADKLAMEREDLDLRKREANLRQSMKELVDQHRGDTTKALDAEHQAQFAAKYGQQPPMQMGPPELKISVTDQANIDVAGPEMLQQVGFAYLKYGNGEAGLILLQLADEQRKTREMAAFYQQILATPYGDPQIRNQALAALGSLMMQTGKSEQALQLLKGAMPPSLVTMIEKTTRETTNILLGRMQQGQAPNIARARKQEQRAKAHTKRALFGTQLSQTSADTGITTTASGERVRAKQSADRQQDGGRARKLHGSR